MKLVFDEWSNGRNLIGIQVKGNNSTSTTYATVKGHAKRLWHHLTYVAPRQRLFKKFYRTVGLDNINFEVLYYELNTRIREYEDDSKFSVARKNNIIDILQKLGPTSYAVATLDKKFQHFQCEDEQKRYYHNGKKLI